jgi:phosphate transport system substrate-binding protein
MKKLSLGLLKESLIVASSLILSAPLSAAVDIVEIDGSSTVYPIAEAVAEEFQIETGIKVTVGVSGTGGGFKKFCRGDTVISNASRPIKAKEIKKCDEAGIDFIEIPVAFDALTVVVNKGNDWANELTIEELKKIWEPAAQGKITNWNQVRPSFPDMPLKLYGPGADSGTFDYFTEAVNGESKAIRGDFTASEDDNIIVKGVAGDKGGMGYFGLAYFTENSETLKAVKIKNAAGKFIMPSLEAAQNGSYNPLSRPLFIYLNAKKAAFDVNVKKFVDFFLNNAKKFSAEVGYVPFTDKEYTAIIDHYKKLKTGTAFAKPAIGLSVEEILKLSASN